MIAQRNDPAPQEGQAGRGPPRRIDAAWVLAALLALGMGCSDPNKRGAAAADAIAAEIAAADRVEDDQSQVIDLDVALGLLDEYELEHLSINVLGKREGATRTLNLKKEGSSAESHVGNHDLELLTFHTREGQNAFGTSGKAQYLIGFRRIGGRPVVIEVCLGH